MNGHVIPNTPIAVDCWKLRNIPEARIFFLTHYHADHMVGLTSSWSYPIYCSPVTGKLLKEHMKIKPHLINVLNLNESHVIDITECGDETITVSVIDANHCPGSVMYIFEGYFGKIFYTGDFRYSKDTIMEIGMLENCQNVDVLYLDNTYCDPSIAFPSREKAKQDILKLIDSHSDYDIVFGMHAFGKEDLLCDIADRYGSCIAVGRTYYEKVKLLDYPDVFTDKPSETNMRVVNLHSVSSQQVKDWNKIWPTLVILVTALYSGIDPSENLYTNIPRVHIVPYSNHSCYPELLEFIRLIKPKKVKPIVTSKRGPLGCDNSNRISMRTFDKYLNREPLTQFNIPKSVRNYMNGSHLKCKVTGTRKRKFSKFRYQRRNSVPQGVVFDQSPHKQKDISSNSGVKSEMAACLTHCDPRLNEKPASLKRKTFCVSATVTSSNSVTSNEQNLNSLRNVSNGLSVSSVASEEEPIQNSRANTSTKATLSSDVIEENTETNVDSVKRRKVKHVKDTMCQFSLKLCSPSKKGTDKDEISVNDGNNKKSLEEACQMELNHSADESLKMIKTKNDKCNNQVGFSSAINGLELMSSVCEKRYDTGLMLFENLVKNKSQVDKNIPKSEPVKTINVHVFRVKKHRSKQERKKQFYQILNKACEAIREND